LRQLAERDIGRFVGSRPRPKGCVSGQRLKDLSASRKSLLGTGASGESGLLSGVLWIMTARLHGRPTAIVRTGLLFVYARRLEGRYQQNSFQWTLTLQPLHRPRSICHQASGGDSGQYAELRRMAHVVYRARTSAGNLS
jgi:hypothetical protein